MRLNLNAVHPWKLFRKQEQNKRKEMQQKNCEKIEQKTREIHKKQIKAKERSFFLENSEKPLIKPHFDNNSSNLMRTNIFHNVHDFFCSQPWAIWVACWARKDDTKRQRNHFSSHWSIDRTWLMFITICKYSLHFWLDGLDCALFVQFFSAGGTPFARNKYRVR